MEIALVCTMSYSCKYFYKFQENPVRNVRGTLAFHWLAIVVPLFFVIRIEERY